ncbi:MAG: sel1 repeat family protein [Deltaproteobacteria bacterium]|nr:MAG: sel1 repeat family protein [Deltaproteobacteria bacterium]
MRHILLAITTLCFSVPALAQESAAEVGLRALVVDFDQDGVDAPADRVMGLYKEACDAGWKPGCEASKWTNGDQARIEDAQAYFQPLCDNGDTIACMAVGWTLSQSPLGTPSEQGDFPDRGATYFKRACEKKNQRACYELGRLAWDGIGTLRDKQRAAALFEGACEGNVVVACKRSADLLLAGEFVKGDPEKASTYFQKACDFGDLSACDSLGELYRAGKGVERSPEKAVELFDRACKRGEASGCRNMALYHVAKGDLKNTVHYYGRGCKAGDGTACADAGKLYESGATGEANAGPRALEMYQLGCSAKEPGSCFAAAQIAEGRLGVKKDSVELVRLYTEGCENGGGAACGQIAHLTLYGREGVSRDRDEGVRLARRGCRAGDGWACYLTGMAYQKGWVGKRDWTQAAGAFQQACIEGVEQACGPEVKARRKAGLGI